MTIRQKLFSLGIIAIAGVLSLVFRFTLFVTETRDLNQAISHLDSLEIRLLNMRRSEKDFLLRMDEKYLGRFNDNAGEFLSVESELSDILLAYELPSSELVKQDLLAYQEGFQQLAEAYKLYGLNETQGLRRSYAEELQQLKHHSDDQQMAKLFLFDENIKSGVYQPEILDGLSAESLLIAGWEIIAQRVNIGIKYNQGLIGETRKLAHTVEEHFVQLSTALKLAYAEREKRLVLTNRLIIIAIFILILGLSWQLSHSINAQINTLLATIRDICETNNMAKRSSLSGRDELTKVGQHLNDLLDKIESLIHSSQSKSAQLSTSTANMHRQLDEAIEQFHCQANHTTSMATAIQQMVATLKEISESTSAAAEGVSQAAEDAVKGRKMVEVTVDNIDSLTTTLSDSKASIASLNRHVDQIDGAVTIIQEIAEQTNLLALNAAIEAARAGEQGRGFAVVADEVRALASRTHQSTVEITRVVSDIQTQMETVVVDINLCNDQGQQTLRASEQLDSGLKKTIEDMQDIRASSERIACAIEQQEVVMHQVSDSISELNVISKSNVDSANECLQEVDLVADQAHEMDNMVALYKTREV